MIDWKVIQQDVNENGLSWNDIRTKYKIHNEAIRNAQKQGLFKTYRKKYTYDCVLAAVKASTNYSDVFRNLNRKVNGGSYKWLKKLITDYSISTDHFVVEMFAGKRSVGHNKVELKGLPELVSTIRVKSQRLTSYLLANEVQYKCSVCGLYEWRGQPIRLDVDHIDSNSENNKLDNLQFLCPNCHRQKTIQLDNKQ